jgi:hypothetical protein
MRKASVVLLTLSYFVLVNGRIARLMHGRPFVGEHVMPGIAMPAGQPGAAAWENALLFSLAFVGVVLALIPLRRGERWAAWTSAAVWAVLGGTRFATDPQCLKVLDVHQHGYHTFVIALVVAVAGLVCSAIKAH